MEGLNIKKIEEPSLEAHEKELKNQFRIFRLNYVDRVFQGQIPPLETEYFSSIENNVAGFKKIPFEDLGFLLERYSDIIHDLVAAYKEQKRTHKSEKIEWTDEEYEEIKNIYTQKISSFFNEDKDTWIEKTLNLITVEEMKARAVKDSLPSSEHNSQENSVSENQEENEFKAGLLSFNLDQGDRVKESLFYNTDYQIKDQDSFIEIHFPDLFVSNFESKDKNIFSNDSLKKLALKIVDKYPETKAVVGQSWILHTAIAERIGFKIYKKRKFAPRLSFWGQFIDSNGQINKKRMDKFLETGEAEYAVASGAIEVEDFLKKYLPKERKGEITLKELNPEFDVGEFKKEQEEFARFYKNFEIMQTSVFANLFYNSKYLQDFGKTEEGKGFFLYFYDQIGKYKAKEYLEKNEKTQHYREAFDKYIESIKYIDKKVVIE